MRVNDSGKISYTQLIQILVLAFLGYFVNIFYKSYVSRAIDDPALFGDFSLTLRMIQLLASLMSLGFVQTIKSFFINYKNNSLFLLLSGVMHYALRVMILVMICFWGVFALFSWALKGVSLNAYEHMLWSSLLITPFFLMMSVCIMMLNLLGQLVLSQLGQLFLRPIAFVLAIFILVDSGIDIQSEVLIQTIYQVMIGLTLILILLLGLVVWVNPKEFPMHLKQWDFSDRSKWWNSSFTFLFMGTAYLLQINFDLYSLELFGEGEDLVGVWVTVTAIPKVIRTLTTSYYATLNPLIQKAKDNQSLQALLDEANRLHAVVIVVITAVIVYFSAPLLSIFGAMYVQYQSLLWMILVSTLVFSCGGDVAYVCLAYRYQEFRWLRIFRLTFVCVSMMGLPLVSYGFGLWGVAWFNLVCGSLGNFLMMAKVRRMGIKPYFF